MSELKKVLDGLVTFVEANPHIQKVHFTEDGNYHLNAYEKDGKLYARIPVEKAALKQFEIKATVTRNQILGIEEEIDEESEEKQPEGEQPPATDPLSGSGEEVIKLETEPNPGDTATGEQEVKVNIEEPVIQEETATTTYRRSM